MKGELKYTNIVLSLLDPPISILFQIKLQKIHIPNYLYWDDTPDPPSGLCIEKGHAFRKNDQSLCTSPERLLIPTEEEEIENRYMFSSEEFENMKYEDPLIKDLKECEVIMEKK